jgi:hypothetical protein
MAMKSTSNRNVLMSISSRNLWMCCIYVNSCKQDWSWPKAPLVQVTVCLGGMLQTNLRSSDFNTTWTRSRHHNVGVHMSQSQTDNVDYLPHNELKTNESFGTSDNALRYHTSSAGGLFSPHLLQRLSIAPSKVWLSGTPHNVSVTSR